MGGRGGGSGRGPFATYGRHDGALLFELCENFVYHLTVQTGKFSYFSGIHGFAGLAHGFKNYIFLVHNIELLKFKKAAGHHCMQPAARDYLNYLSDIKLFHGLKDMALAF